MNFADGFSFVMDAVIQLLSKFEWMTFGLGAFAAIMLVLTMVVAV